LDTNCPDQQSTLLINTIENNSLKYSSRDYSQAVLARKLQRSIGRPSLKSYLRIIDDNLLQNCPVTRRDVMIAEHIFGPDVGSLKGKTVRQYPATVKIQVTSVPESIMSQYSEVTVGGDIMFVNRIPFLVSISRHIYFATAEAIPNQQQKTLLQGIKQIHSIYLQRGFQITHLLMDGQFEHLREHLADLRINLNITSRNEHVPEVERYIRTLKERTRSIYNTLPFKEMPARMVIEMVYACNFWLNSFPHKAQ
jgi:hypothetical protein